MTTDIFSSYPLKQLNEPDAAADKRTDTYWHSLFLFNISRLIIIGGLMVLTWLFHVTTLGSQSSTLFIFVASLYFLLSCLFALLIKLRKPGFNWQLIQQICADVIFISLMSYTSGGLASGLGILLMISVAGGSLISKGRLAFFFAAIATIGILLQEIYAQLYIDTYNAQFTHAGLLSMGYFIVAWFAQQLASSAIASEKLAHQRGIELTNIAQINRLIIQDLQEGILVVDQHGYIRQSNSYAKKLIDIKPQSDGCDPYSLNHYIPELASRLSSWRNNTYTAFDLLRLPKNNTLVKTRFVDIENNPYASVIIYLEDTSRIQSQIQQLKLAALGRLTASIAHEIRNPLSSISHAAELLEEDRQFTDVSLNSEKNCHQRLLHIIYDNAQRLSSIVEDILQLNRRDTVKSESIDAAEFIRQFIHDYCLIEKIDNTVFKLDHASNVQAFRINFDRNHLNQILWNLCSNAWRYCLHQEASITIKLTRCQESHSILLDVDDDGPGVPPHQVKQLFEPFFTTAVNGTGLGLYIARELCEANHASLEYVNHTAKGYFRIICKDICHNA